MRNLNLFNRKALAVSVLVLSNIFTVHNVLASNMDDIFEFKKEVNGIINGLEYENDEDHEYEDIMKDILKKLVDKQSNISNIKTIKKDIVGKKVQEAYDYVTDWVKFDNDLKEIKSLKVRFMLCLSGLKITLRNLKQKIGF